MSIPILATKTYKPPPRTKTVQRERLFQRLNEGLGRKLTLISAPAGFGKTTLVAEWLAVESRRVAWFSLDAEDNEVSRFLNYFIAALRKVADNFGENLLGLIQTLQVAPSETILTHFINEISKLPDSYILVLDDYHLIENKAIHTILTFLLEHLPPQLQLIIITREDPPLPLARLRVRAQLTELRVADLRFTLNETTEFLNQTMQLQITPESITALESRTEGWIAGLQLAAISLQNHKDSSKFIDSFTGSHRFILDYLVEEVLQQQPAAIQDFLLNTAILERMCGELCDVVVANSDKREVTGQETLEYIERANLFIVPLDDERRWYRYHHLFADLLRHRLQQKAVPKIAELHTRASRWFEANGLELEAFQHAAASNDLERAERLIEANGMPLHFRGIVTPVLNWLKSLPAEILDSRPSLWLLYASTLLGLGQSANVPPKLQAAEKALQKLEPDATVKDMLGRVAATWAMLAVPKHDVETIIAQSERALEYLSPDNLPFRTSTLWKLGYAYHLQGKRETAYKIYQEVVETGQKTGNFIFMLTAKIGVACLQENNNQLFLASETFKSVLATFGDKPLPFACEAHLGMARIWYQWNELNTALKHTQESIRLGKLIENSDRAISGELLLARLKFTLGEVEEAQTILAKVEFLAQQHNFLYRLPEIAELKALIALEQGDFSQAAQVAQAYKLTLIEARVKLAQKEFVVAWELLETAYQAAITKNWEDERLKTTVLQAVTYYLQGAKAEALQTLGVALKLAEPAGFIRLFVDEGQPMLELLTAARQAGISPEYCKKLIAIFEPTIVKSAEQKPNLTTANRQNQVLIEPLTERELEILQLIGQGYSNQEIGKQLFLALNTVKGYNQKIFGKLAVQSRTEAIVRARELGLI